MRGTAVAAPSSQPTRLSGSSPSSGNIHCSDAANSTSTASALSTTYGFVVLRRVTTGAYQDRAADMSGSSGPGPGPFQYHDADAAGSSPVRGISGTRTG